MTDRNRRPTPRGSVLILTLWMLLFLGALAAAVGAHVAARVSLASGLRERLRAYAAADAGVEAARAEARRATGAWTDVSQPWSRRTGVFRDVRVGEGMFTLTHLADDRNGVVTNAGLGDEEGRVSLNGVTNDAVKAVFRALLREEANLEAAAADALAASVADWVDPDDSPRPGGSESAYYRALPRPYACRNGPIETPEELLLVKGMTGRILRCVRPFVTVHGGGAVNLNTAGPAVLRSLAMARPDADPRRAGSLVERILAARGNGAVFRSADKRLFREILFGASAMGTSEQEEWVLFEWAFNHRLVSVQSRHFCGICEGRSVRGGPTRQRIGFVLDREKDHIVGWHEY